MMFNISKMLWEIGLGEEAQISGFTDKDIEEKTARMGLFSGETIKCIHKSKVIVIALHYSCIALDWNIAQQIQIRNKQ